MKNTVIKTALLNASLTVLYIAAVASFMFYAPKILGPEEPDTVLVPIFMLSLFVFSAALTGSLVFARPVLWYLDGKKGEALSLLAYTLGFLFIITLAVLGVLFLNISR